MSKHKEKTESETVDDTTNISLVEPEQGDDGDLYLPVDYDEAAEHPLMTYGEALLVGGYKTGSIIDFIGGLVSNGWVVDAIKLMQLLANRETKLGELIDAVQAIIAKNGKPVPPKMKAWAAMGAKKPNREDVLGMLKKKGYDTSKVGSPMIGLLISLAIRFGLPFLEKIIGDLLSK